MITTAHILAYDGKQLLLAPDNPLGREIRVKEAETIELRINDGRSISAEQRKKVFALIRDVSLWCGHEPEEIRKLLTWDYIAKEGIPWFSLSDVDMTTAREFISFLIDFCFLWSVPTRETLLNRTDDIGKYLYACLMHRKCAICNKPAEVHHVDRIGMGRDREEIVHEGLDAIALCREHHNEAHSREKELFEEYHIYGIRLTKELCDSLNLKAESKN